MNNLITYHSTRSDKKYQLSFSQAVLKGIAPDSGLLLPQKLPEISSSEIKKLSFLNYPQKAAYIFDRFRTDFTDEKIKKISRLYHLLHLPGAIL